MIKILLYTFMRYIKLYENFNWSEEDFDYEDEYPVEIIGNQYFTDFLIKRNLYDKFVELVKKCNHDKIHISSIKEINDKIQTRGSLYNVISYLIYWVCVYKLIKVQWGQISIEWNKLCHQNPSYKDIKLYENFDWSDEDFDYEDESPLEIIGNKYFTDFLIDRGLYNKFVESVKKCNHDKIHISSIKEINDLIKIQTRGYLYNSLYDVISYLIYWECAFNLTKVEWSPINVEWNKLCYRNPSYKDIEI